jgi:hypothetical protein
MSVASRSSGAKGKQRSGRRRGTALRACNAQVREDLLNEALTSLRLAFADFGQTPAEFERAVRRSRREKRVPAVSGPLLSEVRGIGDIIEQWSRSPAYTESDGQPRVLSVEGPGATFETLARRALPKMALARVVELAREIGEVGLQPEGKIALFGTIFMSLKGSEERQLAHLVRQLIGLLANGVHNRRNANKHQDEGLISRISTGVIAADKLPSLVGEVRPRIYDLLLGLESSFESRAPQTARELKKASAVELSVFLSADTDLSRAGVASLIEHLKPSSSRTIRGGSRKSRAQKSQ